MRIKTTLIAVATALAVVGVPRAPRLTAQSPSPVMSERRLVFEVASVKENTSQSNAGGGGTQAGGRFSLVNTTANSLVLRAFRSTPPLLPEQIVGMPTWATSLHYDVTAKVPVDAAQDLRTVIQEIPLYVRSLLEDRFAMKAHMEKRDMPIYELRVGPGGHKLRPPTADCATSGPPCPITLAPNHIAGHGFILGGLLYPLAAATGRVVVDKTDLRGLFDLDLQWSRGVATNGPDDLPSIFVAVQEQLGLKLEPARAPVDVLVIDHLERPTPD